VAVARALSATLNREGDLLARFGGEEFAVVLPGADRLGALIVAQRLLQAARAITIRQTDGCGVSISAGTASWHPGTETIKPAQLLDRADQALFAAKADGKNRAIAYEDSLAARDTYQTAITDGLAAGEFELYYQPLIAIETREVVGLEALMRWNRPGHGLVVPDKFIPIAEASTLICELGRWALHEAAGQLATWSRGALTPGDELRVAVNISARHAASPAIIADVRAALTAAGIAPSRLELELTETALTDGVLTGPQLAGLRALGVAVAIDDFGTGLHVDRAAGPSASRHPEDRSQLHGLRRSAPARAGDADDRGGARVRSAGGGRGGRGRPDAPGPVRAGLRSRPGIPDRETDARRAGGVVAGRLARADARRGTGPGGRPGRRARPGRA
jgi:predicted signal transduction protein with EAL and GGDEF domain